MKADGISRTLLGKRMPIHSSRHVRPIIELGKRRARWELGEDLHETDVRRVDPTFGTRYVLVGLSQRPVALTYSHGVHCQGSGACPNR